MATQMLTSLIDAIKSHFSFVMFHVTWLAEESVSDIMQLDSKNDWTSVSNNSLTYLTRYIIIFTLVQIKFKLFSKSFNFCEI